MLIRTNVKGIGDPFVITDGKLYYMYATHSNDGFTCWKSKDLKTWTDETLCLDMTNSWAINCFWAPEVRYHNGKYIMHFTARERCTDSLRTGVAVSDNPMGPFKEVKNGPMFDFGFATIDADAFVDDDGQCYLYYVKDCSENIINGCHTSQIYVAKTNKDLTELVGEPKLILTPDQEYEKLSGTEWRWNEGPFMYKKDGLYYLTYSINCFDSPFYSIGLATSKSPFGPFEKKDKAILTIKDYPTDFSGPGHNNIFTDLNGNLKISFHIHTDPLHPSGDRKACIADCKIEDGNIEIIL